jgi:biofilm PGA synthesis N-glycosyltransferase PgaC
MNIPTLYLIIYGGYIMMCSLAFVYFLTNKRNRKGKGSVANDITVLIPFRDEEKNLVALINGINQLSVQPNKFIFINDHSVDGSLEIIRAANQVNHSIIENVGEGKKNAVHNGVMQATTKYCLTWDADIIMHRDFFTTLEKYEECDMQILPVSMYAVKPLQCFAEVDFMFSNMMNWISAVRRPILASGANLLFCRECYLAENTLDAHKVIASGDDMFLLQDFLKANKNVKVVLNRKLIVETEAPRSLKLFFDQRLRWIGKTKHVKDPYANIFGILTLVLSIIFLISIIFLLVKGSYFAALLLYGGRTILDLIITLPVIIFNKRYIVLLAFPFIEILYPFYGLALIAGTLFYNPKWKGRKV